MEKRFDFLNVLGHLRCTLSSAEAGVHRGGHTIDCVPYTRLLFANNVPSSERPGFLAWSCGQQRERIELQTGCIYMVPKSMELELRVPAGTEMVIVHFLLELFHGYDVFDSASQCSELLSSRTFCRSVYESLLRRDGMRDSLDTLAAVVRVSGHFLHANGEDFQRMATLRQRYAPIALLLLNSQNQQLRVQDLADAVGMQRSTFSKRFRHDLGLSPKEYLTQLQVRRAVDLVSGTDRRLRDIAEELNFSDEYYFSRFFKKHTGSQPSAFRQVHVIREKYEDNVS